MLNDRPVRILALVAVCALITACGSESANGTDPSQTITGSSSPPMSASPSTSQSAASEPSQSEPAPDDIDPLTHRLLSESFEKGAGAFHLGSTADFSYSIVDGVYTITATTKGGGVAQSYGEFARVAYAIDSSVAVKGAEKYDLNTAVGVGCFDAKAEYGLALLVNADNSGGLFLRFRDGKPDSQPLESWRKPVGSGPITSLRLLAAITSPVGDDVELTAWINGVQAPLTAETSGFDGCAGMVLFVIAPDRGVVIGYDDAVAVVPGE